MSFCEFSSEVISNNVTAIDNLFISEYLPRASENCVKVYLYGLYKCGTFQDNSLENFAKVFELDKDDILSIFYYWQEMGLVQVINVDPVQVKYLPVKNALVKMKKYNVDKYTNFNISVQELMGSKMLTPREFEEFYYLIENLHQEKDAVLKIIDYCVKLKGENISVSYVVAVAKNWAYEGIKTSEDVDARISDQDRISGDVSLVLKAMKIKRQATIEEYQQYLTWTKEMDISSEIINHIASQYKCKNFTKLNDMITKCYSLKLESVKEIDEYFDMREKMFSLAKTITKNLGLWYDNLDVVVDTYILPWLQLGMEEDALIKLSNYAFKSSIRTLEGLNNKIANMYKLGLLTSGAIDNYLNDIVSNDDVIAQILIKLDIDRAVNSTDRTFYKTWLYSWNMTSEVIDYACQIAKGKYMPLQYLNKILSEYYQHNIVTLEQAKNYKLATYSSHSTGTKEARKREYSRKELDSLFDDIGEVEI